MAQPHPHNNNPPQQILHQQTPNPKQSHQNNPPKLKRLCGTVNSVDMLFTEKTHPMFALSVEQNKKCLQKSLQT